MIRLIPIILLIFLKNNVYSQNVGTGTGSDDRPTTLSKLEREILNSAVLEISICTGTSPKNRFDGLVDF